MIQVQKLKFHFLLEDIISTPVYHLQQAQGHCPLLSWQRDRGPRPLGGVMANQEPRRIWGKSSWLQPKGCGQGPGRPDRESGLHRGFSWAQVRMHFPLLPALGSSVLCHHRQRAGEERQPAGCSPCFPRVWLFLNSIN